MRCWDTISPDENMNGLHRMRKRDSIHVPYVTHTYMNTLTI
jgi:hypothetical protein